MGACCTAEAYQHHEPVDSNTTYKVLFLGSGGCGKSTIFKQLKRLYGEGFRIRHYKEAVQSIAAFVVWSMYTVLDSDECKIEQFEDKKAISAAEQILSMQDKANGSSITLNEDIVNNIKILWAKPEIKEMFHEQVTYTYYIHYK